MDLVELLRSQARRYRCTSCGGSMADCDIAIVNQQGAQALVKVGCNTCHDEHLLQILFQTENSEAVDEGFPEVSTAIDGDEMLDLHNLLESHQGDLKSLVTAS